MERRVKKAECGESGYKEEKLGTVADVQKEVERNRLHPRWAGVGRFTHLGKHENSGEVDLEAGIRVSNGWMKRKR